MRSGFNFSPKCGKSWACKTGDPDHISRCTLHPLFSRPSQSHVPDCNRQFSKASLSDFSRVKLQIFWWPGRLGKMGPYRSSATWLRIGIRLTDACPREAIRLAVFPTTGNKWVAPTSSARVCKGASDRAMDCPCSARVGGIPVHFTHVGACPGVAWRAANRERVLQNLREAGLPVKTCPADPDSLNFTLWRRCPRDKPELLSVQGLLISGR